MRILEHVETEYNEVDVRENMDGSIDFDVIGATHATWHATRLLTGHAWDAITAGIVMRNPAPTSLLMLGLGGGTVLRQIRHLLPHLRITAVEIDADMVRLAREYMALDTLDLEIVVGDAFQFLEEDTRTYDVVVDDLYRTGDTDVERPRRVDTDSIRLHRSRMREDSLLVMNFVVGSGHRIQHQEARTAFATHFPTVRALRPPLSHNETLVGAPAPGLLHTPRHLKRFANDFHAPGDSRWWKELRNLKLR